MNLREALTFTDALPVPGASEGLAGAKALLEQCGVTGFPVADVTGIALGMNRDMRFTSDDSAPVKVAMTSDNLAALRKAADLAVPPARVPA